MKLVIPPLSIERGSITCLHIPHGSHELGEGLEARVLEFAAWQGKTAAVSKPAGWNTERAKHLNLTTVQWLSQTTGISENESERLIGALGLAVTDRLAWNAGTPRCLLGLIATLAQKPEVLVYSAAALDAAGCHAVHEFVASRCQSLSSIHISYPSVFGNGTPAPRLCPTGANCIELAVVEHSDDQSSF